MVLNVLIKNENVSMLGQRRRRCANIETALGEYAVFAGIGPKWEFSCELWSLQFTFRSNC